MSWMGRKEIKTVFGLVLTEKTDTWKTEKKECNIEMDIVEVGSDSVITGSELCPVVEFGTTDVEFSDFATR